MAPSGEKLLEASVTCSSGGSLKDKPEILMLGMHFELSIWSWYSLLSSLKEQMFILHDKSQKIILSTKGNPKPKGN